MRTSVVIRVRDERAALAELLARLRSQTAAHEVVGVDSGSSDGSGDAAEAAGVGVVRIVAVSFTFGGRPLREPVRQDAAALRARSRWRCSNGAGTFGRALWEQHPFRADLAATEDVEWALCALDRGVVCLLDPAPAVEHDHARDPLRACFERCRREAWGFRLVAGELLHGARAALAEWWSEQGWHRSRARARLDTRRMARLAGRWAGSR